MFQIREGLELFIGNSDKVLVLRSKTIIQVLWLRENSDLVFNSAVIFLFVLLRKFYYKRYITIIPEKIKTSLDFSKKPRSTFQKVKPGFYYFSLKPSSTFLKSQTRFLLITRFIDFF